MFKKDLPSIASFNVRGGAVSAANYSQQMEIPKTDSI
jgi:hypothetical protein